MSDQPAGGMDLIKRTWTITIGTDLGTRGVYYCYFTHFQLNFSFSLSMINKRIEKEKLLLRVVFSGVDDSGRSTINAQL